MIVDSTSEKPVTFGGPNMPSGAPFCVIERPFVVWSNDITRDNRAFLKSIDSDFYFRTAHLLIASGESEGDEDQVRKDASSLARMLWHHGTETLVMLLGAYIQAPYAVHAYFQKCRTEDAICIAQMILSGVCPPTIKSMTFRFRFPTC